MSTSWMSLLRIPASFLEAGVMAMNSGVKSLQMSVERLAGQKSDEGLKEPPVNGPQSLDAAFSDFANHIVRIGRYTPFEANEIVKSAGEIARSVGQTFGYLDLATPRAAILPLAVPFSLAGMMAESALRASVVFSLIGPRRIPRFLRDVTELFSEVSIFTSLQYKDLIERHKERIHQHPEDFERMVDLGRVYVRCGLYDQAIEAFAGAAGNPSTRSIAVYQTAVSHYRAGRFEEAVKSSMEAVAADPANERAKAWLWLSSRSTNGYPESVPAEYRIEMKPGYEPAVVEFEDVAAKIGLHKTSAGRGTAIFDYNNDGYLDIVVTAAHGGCSLYRNNGDGTFTDVSIESGLDGCVNGFVVTAGDYDNDGYVDLFVSRNGFYVGNGTLYHNNGDGTFTDVTEQAGLEMWGPGFIASWVDYDCDGYLDLFISNNLAGLFDRRTPNRLFHNNGDGTFSEVTGKAGLRASAFPTIGACWGDYNNDGLPDLFISSGLGRPELYRNNGDGTFTEIGLHAGLDKYVIASVCFFADFDNDGWLDILQYCWSDHEDVIETMKTGVGPADGNPSCVYKNNRDGTFTRLTREVGLDQCWGTMSGNFGDINNDGHLDLLLGNGSPLMDRLDPMVIMESDGKRYRNTTFSAGLPFTGKSHGVNCGDLWGDGRMSIIVAGGGAYPGDLLGTSVYRARKLAGNYLNVRLRGTKSNRDAIGARITLLSGETRQMREVNGGTNFGCLPMEQHFGLATLDKVDALEIRWPSGLRQRVENPPVNNTIRITEGEPGWKEVYAR